MGEAAQTQHLHRTANGVDADAVLGELELLLQKLLELLELPWGQPALEHRKLYPLAKALEHVGHLDPAAIVGDVVGNGVEAFVGHFLPNLRVSDA